MTKYGRPSACRAGIEHLRYIWMVKEGKHLALCFEARDYRLCVHPRLDDFDCNLSLHRSRLFGEIRNTAASLAKLLEELIRPDTQRASICDPVFGNEGCSLAKGVDQP